MAITEHTEPVSIADLLADKQSTIEHARNVALNTPIPGTIIARCLARGGTSSAADAHQDADIDPEHVGLWRHTYTATLQGRARAALDITWLTVVRTDATHQTPWQIDPRAQIMAKLAPRAWIIATPTFPAHPWAEGWHASNNATDYANHALYWALNLHPHLHTTDADQYHTCQILSHPDGYPIGPARTGERRCRDAVTATTRNILPRIMPWTIEQ